MTIEEIIEAHQKYQLQKYFSPVEVEKTLFDEIISEISEIITSGTICFNCDKNFCEKNKDTRIKLSNNWFDVFVSFIKRKALEAKDKHYEYIEFFNKLECDFTYKVKEQKSNEMRNNLIQQIENAINKAKIELMKNDPKPESKIEQEEKTIIDFPANIKFSSKEINYKESIPKEMWDILSKKGLLKHDVLEFSKNINCIYFVCKFFNINDLNTLCTICENNFKVKNVRRQYNRYNNSETKKPKDGEKLDNCISEYKNNVKI